MPSGSVLLIWSEKESLTALPKLLTLIFTRKESKSVVRFWGNKLMSVRFVLFSMMYSGRSKVRSRSAGSPVRVYSWAVIFAPLSLRYCRLISLMVCCMDLPIPSV